MYGMTLMPLLLQRYKSELKTVQLALKATIYHALNMKTTRSDSAKVSQDELQLELEIVMIHKTQFACG